MFGNAVEQKGCFMPSFTQDGGGGYRGGPPLPFAKNSLTWNDYKINSLWTCWVYPHTRMSTNYMETSLYIAKSYRTFLSVRPINIART